MNRAAGSRGLRFAVLALNTFGLLAYLAWLVWGHQRIFYAQDGILYLLPCLAFVFVYAMLFRGPRTDVFDDDEEGD